MKYSKLPDKLVCKASKGNIPVSGDTHFPNLSKALSEVLGSDKPINWVDFEVTYNNIMPRINR